MGEFWIGGYQREAEYPRGRDKTIRGMVAGKVRGRHRESYLKRKRRLANIQPSKIVVDPVNRIRNQPYAALVRKKSQLPNADCRQPNLILWAVQFSHDPRGRRWGCEELQT